MKKNETGSGKLTLSKTTLKNLNVGVRTGVRAGYNVIGPSKDPAVAGDCLHTYFGPCGPPA